MPLAPEKKQQLLGVIKKMKANNEPEERIQQMVSAFKTKHGNYPDSTARPSASVQDSLNVERLKTNPEVPQTINQMVMREQPIYGLLMPSAARESVRGGVGSNTMTLRDYGEVLNTPTRLFSVFSGQSPYDPDSYLFKPAYERAQEEYEATTPEQRAAPGEEYRVPPQLGGPQLTGEQRKLLPPMKPVFNLSSDPLNFTAMSNLLLKGGRKGLSKVFGLLSGNKRPGTALEMASDFGKGRGRDQLKSAASGRAGRIEEAGMVEKLSRDEAEIAAQEFGKVKDLTSEQVERVKDLARKSKERAKGGLTAAELGKEKAEAGLKEQMTKTSRFMRDFLEDARSFDPVKRKHFFPEDEAVKTVTGKLPNVDIAPSIKSIEKQITELESLTGGAPHQTEPIVSKLRKFIDHMKGLDKSSDASQRAKFFKTKYPASEVLELRRMVDKTIKNWDPATRTLLDKNLTPLRNTLAKSLEDAAIASGNPEYISLMKNWSNKLQAVSQLEKKIGTTPDADKAVKLIKNIIEKGPQSDRDLEVLRNFESMFNVDFLPAPVSKSVTDRIAKNILDLSKEKVSRVSEAGAKRAIQAKKAAKKRLEPEEMRVEAAKQKVKEAKDKLAFELEGPKTQEEALAQAINVGEAVPKMSRITGKPITQFGPDEFAVPSLVSPLSTASKFIDKPIVYALGRGEQATRAATKALLPASIARLFTPEEKEIIERLPKPLRDQFIKTRIQERKRNQEPEYTEYTVE